MGISRKIEEGRLAKPNVLGNFPPEEQDIIKNELAPKVERIIKGLVEEGREKTMSSYNSK
jgi:peptidyl-tRNA hydrolase